MGNNRFTNKKNGALAAGAVVIAGGLLLTGFGVYAGLNAVATGSTDVTGGTLSLTIGADGNSTGFPQTVSNMAPGDVYNTYVNLTNGTSSNLPAQSLTLAVAAPASPLLTPPVTDGGPNNGLTVTVSSCSQAWTVTRGTPGSATCGGSGGATQLLSQSAASLSSAATLVSGAIAAGAVYHLQVTLTLPSSVNETTTNGVVPTGGIQGQSVTLAYTFGETQRTATVTNS